MAGMTENYDSIILKRIYESEFANEKVYLLADEDNQKFPVHTILLAVASKYFTVQLGPDFKDGGKSEFELEGFDVDTIKATVDYCYTGRINLTEDNVGTFLAIASRFQFDLLEAECCRFYEGNLSPTNCVDAFIVADKYSYANLRHQAVDLICRRFTIVPTEEIQRLGHRLLQEVLKSDKIQSTEELVVQRLMEWFHSSEVDRKPHMADLLNLIRLDLITSQFLIDTIEPVYERFDRHMLLFAEYKRRALSHRSHMGARSCGPVFCLFLQYKGENNADQSAIKIERFNVTLNTLEECGVISLGTRTLFGAVLQREKIFVLGGMVNGQYLKSASVFDLSTGNEEILPVMNSARGFFAPILHGKYIYAFGGYDGRPINSCERFDTEAKRWEIINALSIARSSYSVTPLNEQFYVAGGDSNTVELYDPEKDNWTLVAAMTVARYRCALTSVNEFLYALGDTAYVERYDMAKNIWTQVQSFEGCEHATSGITDHGESFVILNNGKFGRMKINSGGKCTFVQMGNSKHKSSERGRHFLCYNEM